MLLRAGGEQDQLPAGLLAVVGEDRREITVTEPPSLGARAQSALDLGDAVQL